MFKPLTIRSHKGDYQVHFADQLSFDQLGDYSTLHFIIDKNVADIYAEKLKDILAAPSALIIEATEHHKSLDQFPQYVEHLVKHKIRRDHKLIAIGGGIIQDITCFLAATLLRGIEWWFYPTTLLAQADSCIGSKSSVNCSGIKNILGTYTPPKQIFIYTDFLHTLQPIELNSGIGEMLKVHAIESRDAFSTIAADYDKLFQDTSLMLHYIYRSLEIKKAIIEQDEFDQGIRNIMNYGHTFGHAIESATQYAIPHGVAVTIGIDMANYIADKYGYCEYQHFDRMHPCLKKNYQPFSDYNICLDTFINAISKDKKNKGANQLGLILPNKQYKPTRYFVENDQQFYLACQEYFTKARQL